MPAVAVAWSSPVAPPLIWKSPPPAASPDTNRYTQTLNADRLFYSCSWRKVCQHSVEPVLKHFPNCHNDMVSQDRWSLETGSMALKCETCQEYVVLQDRWCFMAVVFQNRFHCTKIFYPKKKLNLLGYFSTSLSLAKSQLLSYRWLKPQGMH